jgi:hypothetical protein
MDIEQLIYDVKVEIQEYCIYVSDISNIILEYIKEHYDCEIYKKNYSTINIYNYKIYFNHNSYDYEQLIIYLRNNGYKYVRSLL